MTIWICWVIYPDEWLMGIKLTILRRIRWIYNGDMSYKPFTTQLRGPLNSAK